MSTDQQRYSLEFQTLTNAAFAVEHRLEIVRTYADAGVSGLTLSGRAELRRLLADILGGHADFQTVLVYDVSRWGRFQDPDQAAHYEFICRQAGVEIIYTAEPFINDGSLGGTLVKHMKRAMAAEYSRELSAKVSGAKQGLLRKGYWVGGPCGYGLRRQTVAPDGARGVVMQTHEHKAIRGHRTVIVPGPDAERAIVRRIFKMFVVEGLRVGAIADLLNAEEIAAEGGTTWTTHKVVRLLGNERYLGVLVGDRARYRFSKRRTQPEAAWVRIPDALPPTVSQGLFDAAQANLHKHKRRVDDETLVAELQSVLARVGRLSRTLIENDSATHAVEVYRRRFGSLMAAYAKAGYVPTRQQQRAAETAVAPCRRPATAQGVREEALIEELRALLRQRGRLTVALINDSPACHSAEAYRRRLGGMRRAYALCGYVPSEAQEIAMAAHGGQAIDHADALPLRASLARLQPSASEPDRQPRAE